MHRKLSLIGINTYSNPLKYALNLNIKLLMNGHKPLKNKSKILLHLLAINSIIKIKKEREMEYGMFALCDYSDESLSTEMMLSIQEPCLRAAT